MANGDMDARVILIPHPTPLEDQEYLSLEVVQIILVLVCLCLGIRKI